jgi:hypothetical protein
MMFILRDEVNELCSEYCGYILPTVTRILYKVSVVDLQEWNLLAYLELDASIILKTVK